ncbi:ankyrin repeat domain-containing protein [Holosporaceae bacterium 'Namur']|nr:ankyrin repeat domain-containing protein [Holosporaceae bacterium 'Namur']
MYPNYLLNCDLKTIFKTNTFKICRIEDSFTDKRYYYVVNLNEALYPTEIKDFFKISVNDLEGTVAKVGFNSVYKLNSKELIIFINTPPQLVREKVFNDKIIYPYTISFKIAKYHAYISIREKETDLTFDFGLAPAVYGSTFGASYIRNETLYDNKHFKKRKREGFGQEDLDEAFERGARDHVVDWASMSVEIDLINDQVMKIESFLHQANSKLYKNNYFLFGKNCVDFTNKIFAFIFGKGSFIEYCMDDSLELQDKGVLYAFISAYPEIAHKFIPQILNALINLSTGKNLLEFLNTTYLSLNNHSNKALLNIIDALSVTFYEKKGFEIINEIFFKDDECFNDNENTELHVAAYNEDIEFLNKLSLDYLLTNKNNVNCLGESSLHIAASKSYIFTKKLLEVKANPNFPNTKGLTPLHSAITSQMNGEKKYQIVEALLDAGANPNLLDITGFNNPLVEAVKNDDVELFKLILKSCYFRTNLREIPFSIQYGYNFGIKFTNPDGKNLARIAVDKGKEKMKKYFKINHYELFNQKANDGHTPREFEKKLRDWSNGELKYHFKTIKFPFEYYQKQNDSEKNIFEEQEYIVVNGTFHSYAIMYTSSTE